MKLTKVQKAMITSIYEPGWPDSWWECSPAEKRTTDALERMGLLAYSDNPVNAHISFDVMLTKKGREVSEALTKRTRETT